MNNSNESQDRITSTALTKTSDTFSSNNTTFPSQLPSNTYQETSSIYETKTEEDPRITRLNEKFRIPLQKPKQSSLLEVAKTYAARGISVIPIREKNKIPAISSWKEYQSRRPTEDELEMWFGNDSTNNIGIVTGKISGIAVIDLDTEEAVENVKSKGGLLTPTVRTCKGYHLYCRYQDGVRNFQKRADLPGIDLRAEGGYVVAPPSVHESGHIYKWEDEKGLDDIPLAELPPWIIAKKPEEKEPISDLLNGVSKGGRNNALARLLGSWINDNKDISLSELSEKAILWNRKNKPPLPEHEVRKTLESIFKTHLQKQESVPIEWEVPLLFGEIETPEIPSSLLPGWLGEYCKAVSDSMQTPSGMAVMMGLSIIATCLQTKFEVAPHSDDYKEPVNLWTLTALPPGTRKTAVKKAMTEPLMAWEKEQNEILMPEIKKVKTERTISEKRLEILKVKASKTLDKTERENFIKEIEEIENSMPEEKRPLQLWTDDITPEKLQMSLSENDERMALLSDEGGIFEIMSGLYSDGKVNINVFLQSHAGSPVRVERGSRTVYLQKPALTFGLVIQPEILSEFSQGSKRKFRGNGTLARFLYCIPKSNVGSRNISQRVQIPESIQTRYKSCIFDLLRIPPYMENGIEKARVLTLNKEALDLWISFSQQIENKQGVDGEYEYIQDWTGKLPGAAARIAGFDERQL